MEWISLGILGAGALVATFLTSRPSPLGPEQFLRNLPPPPPPGGPFPGFRRPVSGMVAERTRKHELITVVRAAPDHTAQVVKQWLQE